MAAAEFQVRLGEDRAACAVPNIVSEPAQVGGEIMVVLAEKLRHPRRLIQFVKTVLQGVLEGIARCHQPIGLTSFGADGQ
ncbi:hypothetical protein D3C85_1717100 [compost metagenome]